MAVHLPHEELKETATDYVNGKGKGKFLPITGHEGPEVE